VSKLDQWEIVFSQMDAKGIQLHFVTTETENDTKFEGSASGFADIRKLYYRELVARFSHHHNVIWNIGEENDNSVQQVKDFADYIHAQDPYDHPVTVHTHGGSALTRYANFYGHPTMEATSIQGSGGSYNDWAIQIRQLSAQAGRKWAVYGDEQGPAVNSSMNNLDQLRKQALWGNYMGGGAGVEWYFGYQGTFGDIQSEDWTVAEPLWNMTKYAMDFFQTYLPFDEMEPDNNLTSASGDYCFYKAGQVYAVYLPSGGTTNINLPDGSYTVKWYDPRNGGALQDGSVTTINGPGTFGIGQAPSNTSLDWTVLITTDLVANIPGDINNDGRVNTTDLAALVTEWLRCNDPADLGCEEILPVMAAYPSESIQAAAPTTGLVHHWKLDEATGNTTVVDSVSALNGVSNAGTAAVAGKVGNALWFDGAETAAGGEVTISNFLTTDLKTMTLAFWVKPDQNTLPFASIKRLIGGADSFEVVIQQNTNKVANNLYIAGGTYPISTGQLDDATPSWTHVAMTAQLSGGTVTTQIYMNGVLDTPTGSATATDWGGGTLKFGMRTGAANNGHFKGALDEIRIYNRILSASEIQDVYSDNGDGNNAPQVNAGPDQIAFLRGPTAFQMTASAIDDGKPLPPVLTLAWTVQSKPAGATVAFSPDTAAEDPLVTVDTVGVYVLRLTANDSQISAYDEMIINAVNPICSYVIANNLLMASDLSGPMGSPDCRVNFYDFVIIARNWLSTGLYPNDSE
jgi:hypothetical protein